MAAHRTSNGRYRPTTHTPRCAITTAAPAPMRTHTYTEHQNLELEFQRADRYQTLPTDAESPAHQISHLFKAIWRQTMTQKGCLKIPQKNRRLRRAKDTTSSLEHLERRGSAIWVRPPGENGGPAFRLGGAPFKIATAPAGGHGVAGSTIAGRACIFTKKSL